MAGPAVPKNAACGCGTLFFFFFLADVSLALMRFRLVLWSSAVTKDSGLRDQRFYKGVESQRRMSVNPQMGDGLDAEFRLFFELFCFGGFNKMLGYRLIQSKLVKEYESETRSSSWCK